VDLALMTMSSAAVLLILDVLETNRRHRRPAPL
jgi:hypothetical protein